MRPRRNWNYNLADDDRDGRILIKRELIHPNAQVLVDAAGFVDLAPFAGTLVPILRSAILKILGTKYPKVERLIKAGLIKRRDDTSGLSSKHYDKYYLFDPAWTLRILYERWSNGMREPESNAEFKFAKLMQSGCRAPLGSWPPAAVIRGLAKKLGPDARFGAGDVNAYITLPSGGVQPILDELRALVGTLTAAHLPKAQRHQIDEAEFSEFVPFLRGAKGTCFDPVLGSEFASPDSSSRGRLQQLGPLFEVAAVFAYSQAPLLRHPGMLPRYLKNIARFEAEALAWNPAFDPKVPSSLQGAVEHVAFGRLERNFNPAMQFEIVRDAITVLTRARQKCDQYAQAGQSATAAVAPAYLTNRAELLERLYSKYRDHLGTHRDRRKKVSDRISDRYARVVDAAAFRVRQVIEDGDATRAAIDHLLERANAQLAYHDFDVEGLNLSERGLPCGGRQIRRYRIWRYEAAVLSVGLDRSPDDEPPPNRWMNGANEVLPLFSQHARKPKRGIYQTLRRSPQFHGSEFIVEYLGTRAVTFGQEPITAWYITLAEHHSLARSTHLDLEQLGRRELLTTKWCLPKHRNYTNGLLGFNPERTRLAQVASRSDRNALRTFVPIEEFEHAIRMAGHGVDAVISTWCRCGEWMQQTVYGDDWEPMAGTEGLGWRAIPKLARGEPLPNPVPFFEASDDHFDEAMNIADITRRRCHRGGDLPDVEPPSDFAWKCKPQPFVFSFNSRFVDPQDLSYFLLILFTNIGEFRWHDLRHAVSNNARNKKASIDDIRLGLRQRSRTHALYYSQLTEQQARNHEKRISEQKRVRIARDQQGRNAA